MVLKYNFVVLVLICSSNEAIGIENGINLHQREILAQLHQVIAWVNY